MSRGVNWDKIRREKKAKKPEESYSHRLWRWNKARKISAKKMRNKRKLVGYQSSQRSLECTNDPNGLLAKAVEEVSCL